MIRQSTKQTNRRVAEQIEAAQRTALAKGEVGNRKRKPIPTLRDFAENDFLPYVRSTFAAKVKTKAYYQYGVKSLLADTKLAGETLDLITSEKVAGYVAKRQEAGLQVASINRELQVLRRMFHLAQEWGKVRRRFSLGYVCFQGNDTANGFMTAGEEKRYLDEAEPLLQDVATVLVDCGLRPEECFRLKWENVRNGSIEIQYGKTDNARRRIPVSQRVGQFSKCASGDSKSEWVFPAATRSGHIEPGSLKRQHLHACEGRENARANAKAGQR